MKDVSNATDRLWAVIVVPQSRTFFFDDEAKAITRAREYEAAKMAVFVARVTHVADPTAKTAAPNAAKAATPTGNSAAISARGSVAIKTPVAAGATIAPAGSAAAVSATKPPTPVVVQVAEDAPTKIVAPANGVNGTAEVAAEDA